MSSAAVSPSSFSFRLPRLSTPIYSTRLVSSNNNSEAGSNENTFNEQQEKRLFPELVPQLLALAGETDPILHHRIEEMPLAYIHSHETNQAVANMLYSIQPKQLETANAPYNKAAGMAANQWGINKRIFLFCPDGSDPNVKVVFNPTYKPINPPQDPAGTSDTTTNEQFTNFARESCFSVSHAYGMVERYTHIEISYVDSQGVQHLNEKLSGWQARVWQHETDHLNGILYSNKQSGIECGPNCTELHRFSSKTEFEEQLQKKH